MGIGTKEKAEEKEREEEDKGSKMTTKEQDVGGGSGVARKCLGFWDFPLAYCYALLGFYHRDGFIWGRVELGKPSKDAHEKRSSERWRKRKKRTRRTKCEEKKKRKK